MWYAICLGIGFAIGAGFLIWGLRERSLRNDAEKAIMAFEARVADLERIGKQAATTVENLRAELTREHARVLVLRSTLEQAQQRLLACNDPETIKKWLEDELAETI